MMLKMLPVEDEVVVVMEQSDFLVATHPRVKKVVGPAEEFEFDSVVCDLVVSRTQQGMKFSSKDKARIGRYVGWCCYLTSIYKPWPQGVYDYYKPRGHNEEVVVCVGEGVEGEPDPTIWLQKRARVYNLDRNKMVLKRKYNYSCPQFVNPRHLLGPKRDRVVSEYARTKHKMQVKRKTCNRLDAIRKDLKSERMRLWRKVCMKEDAKKYVEKYKPTKEYKLSLPVKFQDYTNGVTADYQRSFSNLFHSVVKLGGKPEFTMEDDIGWYAV